MKSSQKDAAMAPIATSPLPAAFALKKRAMILDAETIHRLRAAHRLTHKLVHEIRLTAKRQRAWWRLARPIAGKTVVRHASDRLAAAARLLAPVRDAYVMRRALARLASENGRENARAAFAAAKADLAAVSAGSPPTAYPVVRDPLIRILVSDAASWRRLPVPPGVDLRIFAEAIKIYRHARRRGRRAIRCPTSANLHSWRKWIKMLVVHAELILGQRRSTLRAEIAQLVRLGRTLGRCHDLMVLDGWLAWRASSGAVSRKDSHRMRALLSRRQQNLRARCVRLGGRLLAEKPKNFALRLAKSAEIDFMN